MHDAGNFKLTWVLLPTGERTVICRELPGLSIVVPGQDDLDSHVEASLKEHLADKYDIAVNLACETNTMTFRCFVAS